MVNFTFCIRKDSGSNENIGLETGVVDIFFPPINLNWKPPNKQTRNKKQTYKHETYQIAMLHNDWCGYNLSIIY